MFVTQKEAGGQGCSWWLSRHCHIYLFICSLGQLFICSATSPEYLLPAAGCWGQI